MRPIMKHGDCPATHTGRSSQRVPAPAEDVVGRRARAAPAIRSIREQINQRFEALLRRVQANRPSEDVSLIRKAWEFCVKHHDGPDARLRRAVYHSSA